MRPAWSEPRATSIGSTWTSTSCPLLGRTKLSALTVPVIRDFETKLRTGEGWPDGEKHPPRSEAMVRKVVGSLSSILSDAMERGRVNRNVVREMRGRRKPGKARRAEGRRKGKLKVGVDIPTADEVRAVLGAVAGRWRPLLLMAVFTGLRASELRGLRWENVDLDAARSCTSASGPIATTTWAGRSPRRATGPCR